MLWLGLVVMKGNIVDAWYNWSIDLTWSNYKQNVKILQSSSKANAVNHNFSDTKYQYAMLIGWGNVFGFIMKIYESYKFISSYSKNLEICLVSLCVYSIKIFMGLTGLPSYVLFCFCFFFEISTLPKTPLNNCINYS